MFLVQCLRANPAMRFANFNTIGFLITVALVPMLYSVPRSEVFAATVDAAIHPLFEIETAVDQFIQRSSQSNEQDVSVTIKSLDRRLRLSRCSEPLNTEWSPGSRMLGRVTVQVGCASPKPWRIHVQASVTMEGTVWTLSRSVRRGETLSEGIVSQQVVVHGSNNAAFRSRGSPVVNIKPLIGYTFVQRANAGQILEARLLKPANLVSKGEVVIINHQSSGLSLRTKGIALKDAAANQQLQVKNSASGRIINVIAVSRGTVQTMH